MAGFWRQLGFRPWQREWWQTLNVLLSAKTFSRKAVIGIMVLCVLVVIAVDDSRPDPSRIMSNESNRSAYQPRNDDERQLFANLRMATRDEAMLMVQRAEREGLALTFIAYVATGDITLPPHPLGQVVIIALPFGVQWVGGPLTNQQLMFATSVFETPALQAVSGYVAYNSMCNSDLVQPPIGRICDPESFKPATQDEMFLRTCANLMSRS